MVIVVVVVMLMMMLMMLITTMVMMMAMLMTMVMVMVMMVMMMMKMMLMSCKDQYKNKTYRVVKEFEGGLTAYGHEGLCVRAVQADGGPGTSHVVGRL